MSELDLPPDEIQITVENDVHAILHAGEIPGMGKYHNLLLCVIVGLGGGFVACDDLWHGVTYRIVEIGFLIMGRDDGQPNQFDPFVWERGTA